MIAIVTAGGKIQPKDPLYAVSGGGIKAMMDVAGKPMIQWVLDALGQAESIERVIVVGLPLEIGLDCARPLVILPDNGDMISNIQAGAREANQIDPSATHALLASSDLPALRSEIVDWLTGQCSDPSPDIYYTVIERAVMETRFPGVRRTYVRLKDMELCGADVHCFRLKAVLEESPLWKRLMDARKSPFKQASLLGYDTMFFLILRQLSLQAAEATACKRLGVLGRAVLSPYAEIGMDVDKPAHLEIIREYLAGHHEKHV